MFGNPDDNQGVDAQNTTNNMGGQPSINSPFGSTGLDTPVAPASPATTVAPTPSDNDNNFVMTEPAGQSAPSSSPAMPDSSFPGANADSGDLAEIKRQALQQLSPLVSHLEQPPEEEFRTTMMMIQASDDQSLIQKAYAAAQKISDEKTRAQALLDIVNEINYFTQQKSNDSTPAQSNEE